MIDVVEVVPLAELRERVSLKAEGEADVEEVSVLTEWDRTAGSCNELDRRLEQPVALLDVGEARVVLGPARDVDAGGEWRDDSDSAQVAQRIVLPPSAREEELERIEAAMRLRSGADVAAGIGPPLRSIAAMPIITDIAIAQPAAIMRRMRIISTGQRPPHRSSCAIALH